MLSAFTLCLVAVYDLPNITKFSIIFLLSIATYFYLRQLTRLVVRLKNDIEERSWWLKVNDSADWLPCESIQHLNFGPSFIWVSICGKKIFPINLLLDGNQISPDIMMQLRRRMLLTSRVETTLLKSSYRN